MLFSYKKNPITIAKKTLRTVTLDMDLPVGGILNTQFWSSGQTIFFFCMKQYSDFNSFMVQGTTIALPTADRTTSDLT